MVKSWIAGLLACAVALDGAAAGSMAADAIRSTPSVGGDLSDGRRLGVGQDWQGVGGSPDEQHFSPLQGIAADTVSGLKLAWSYDIPGIVASVSTPLEIAGTLYFVVGHGVVRALDAETGVLRWEVDPHSESAPDANLKMRVSWGVRGLAYGDGRIYVGTADGRLLAIDAASGSILWTVKTTEAGDGRYISGPPRFFGGKVIIGHGGSDSAYVRGYVTAYDARSGARVWRFYTVPGNPANGFESHALERAASTWSGRWWRYGGGGTVWNAITYDPEQHLIFIGTGNGVPWNRKIRSPRGGDNLFICSIIALNARTGAYVWHYQVSPGDAWDYDATQDMALATLTFGGKPRKVLMQASKNGFFYVIDRTTGRLLSAEKYGHETWAKRVDLATGRPVESANARYERGPAEIWPDPNGEHNWHAMSFNPGTGLAYIPSFATGIRFDDSRTPLENWPDPPLAEARFGVDFAPPTRRGISALIAWDPVKGMAAWRVALEPGIHGGTLTTGGNLVFQGRADGRFIAYDAMTGKSLWSFDAQSGIVGAPIAFEVAGREYVSVLAGYSGFAGVAGGLGARYGWDARTLRRRVLTFSLDGNAPPLPPAAPSHLTLVDDPTYAADTALAGIGAAAYGQRCYICHGAEARAGGQAPDLRTSNLIVDPRAFAAVLHDGTLQALGMPGFPEVGAGEIEAIRQYLRQRAAEDRHGQP